jgi:hypothetical protein
MRCSGLFGSILTGSGVLAVLAGCSGGGSSSPAPLSAQGATTQSTLRSASTFGRSMSTSVARLGARGIGHPDLTPDFADPDAPSTGAVVISDGEANEVFVFNTAGIQVAKISGFSEPQGLAADSAGDIYVADTVNGRIVEYKNDYKTKVATYTDANQYPVGLGVDNATGVVGPGSVSFYAKGKTSKPCKTVSATNWERVYFGAFGPRGNFFISGENASGTPIFGEVKGECSATSITTLAIKNSIEFPGGVQVDKNGDILFEDQEGLAIYAYKAPTGGSFGAPVATTQLENAGDPVTFALTAAESTVWTADASLVEGIAYKFPAGGDAIHKISSPSFEQPIGVIVTPVAPN